MAEAKQIINVDLDRKLILDKDKLKEILRDEIKDLPVVVISIVGTYRQGKSFLLNFFLRFLTITCKEKKTVEDWLNPEDGTLSGFVWKSSSKRETVGIMMWHEVFISTLPSGEEVGIVLLDTQGTYDNQTNMKDFATIIALSTLVSSVQIYNMMNTIKQNELLSLKDFLDYGQLINEEQSGAPFQNLIFLVRDWLHVEEHPYGDAGGERYLQEQLGLNPEDDEDLTNLKQSIFKFFSKTSAFLLPEPGDRVVKNKGTNDLADMNADFKAYVKLLVETILKPENLVVKRVNGHVVRVSDLFIFIQKYHELFQSGKMPEVKSMFQATAEAQHQSAVEDCVKIYQDSMAVDVDPGTPAEDEASLESRHETNKQSALEEFEKKKKMGDEQTKLKFQEKLIERIDTAFGVYQNANRIKLDREEAARQKEMLMKQNEENERAMALLKKQYEDAKDETEQGKREKEEIERKLKQQEQERSDNERRIQEIEERREKMALALKLIETGGFISKQYFKYQAKMQRKQN